jgi:adenylate kinase family enzyme
VQRVVILGRGASGKSTLAEELGALTDLPVIHLDEIFWGDSPEPMRGEAWSAAQDEFVRRRSWIAEGDLGPYDVLDVRLCAADTVVLLDFSLPRCAWRAIRRSRERADFWHWLWSYRRRWRPRILSAARAVAPRTELHILRTPSAVRTFLADVRRRRDSARGR